MHACDIYNNYIIVFTIFLISAALVIYSAPKRPHIVASTMPKRCVVAGCDKGSDGQFSLFTFPKNPERRAQWSREVAKTRSDWPKVTIPLP